MRQGMQMPPESRKGKGILFLRASKRCQPCPHRDSDHSSLKLTQNCKRINLCSFKPPNLWLFVTLAIENWYMKSFSCQSIIFLIGGVVFLKSHLFFFFFLIHSFLVLFLLILTSYLPWFSLFLFLLLLEFNYYFSLFLINKVHWAYEACFKKRFCHIP